MSAAYSTVKSPERVVARFLLEYYNIWDKYFPGLNKRRSVLNEIPFTSPFAPVGTGNEPSFTRLATPPEMS